MKLPGVTRIEGPENRGSGWMVRLTRNGKTAHKWFADGLHGGKVKAKRAAVQHREELVAAAPPVQRKGRKSSRNKTGKVGVMLQNKVDARKDTVYEYQNYVAFWTAPNDAIEQITFACEKYGKRIAFKLASIARDHQTTDRDWIERRYKTDKQAARR